MATSITISAITALVVLTIASYLKMVLLKMKIEIDDVNVIAKVNSIADKFLTFMTFTPLLSVKVLNFTLRYQRLILSF